MSALSDQVFFFLMEIKLFVTMKESKSKITSKGSQRKGNGEENHRFVEKL